jgi:RNase P subunit RPR2
MYINQEGLLAVVWTWHIGPGFRYRGFKCGNCRKYLHTGWHYWLNKSSFRTPVHLCRACNKNIALAYPAIKSDPDKIKFPYPRFFQALLARLISRWRIDLKARYKPFTCDSCQRPIHKAYHIFTRFRNKVSEVHICRECWASIRPKYLQNN